MRNKNFVEFGYQTTQGSNTAALRARGWSGLLLESLNSNPLISLYKVTVSTRWMRPCAARWPRS